ncbi:glycosyltransferase, partial [Saccharothrix sp. MB29]|nr:glycosyltransferase [Saccharothrix sp. MB29]
TPLSGVVVEFLKTARRLRGDNRYRVHLDLGYDIKADKNAFFRPYRDEAALLPDWVVLDRVAGLEDVPGYDRAFVERVLTGVVQNDDPGLLEQVGRIAADIADRIEET